MNVNPPTKLILLQMSRSLCIGVLFAVSLSVQAEVYKWVDEQGKTHYGDKPVNNAQQMEMDTEAKGHINTGQTRENKRRRLIDAFEEDRTRDNEEKQKKRQKKEKYKRKCVWTKDRLRRYERARYLYDLDSDGNRVVIPDVDRQKSMDALRRQAKKYCK
ncbi:hypothetical protein MNBD_GAMMA11-2319 [hydrothermal vent metagenome]|uniref:DUF4124 domain-containing protein n=1 Tax=hydrothermal vent metagenome TaxID=652676 RepID=A0A3B0XG04_9ZZZZ